MTKKLNIIEKHFKMEAGKYRFKKGQQVYVYDYVEKKPKKITILGCFGLDDNEANGYYYYQDGDHNLSNYSEWALSKTKKECLDFKKCWETECDESKSKKQFSSEKLPFKAGDKVYRFDRFKFLAKETIIIYVDNSYTFHENGSEWVIGKHAAFSTKKECIKDGVKMLRNEIEMELIHIFSRLQKIIKLEKDFKLKRQ